MSLLSDAIYAVWLAIIFSYINCRCSVRYVREIQNPVIRIFSQERLFEEFLKSGYDRKKYEAAKKLRDHIEKSNEEYLNATTLGEISQGLYRVWAAIFPFIMAVALYDDSPSWATILYFITVVSTHVLFFMSDKKKNTEDRIYEKYTVRGIKTFDDMYSFLEKICGENGNGYLVRKWANKASSDKVSEMVARIIRGVLFLIFILDRFYNK